MKLSRISWRAGGRSGTGGFSLTELLAVVVVLGVLAALLLPVLTRAKRRGGEAACLNNIRQLNQGLLQFVQEKDEFPFDGTVSQGFFIWQRAISMQLFGEGEKFWYKNEGIFDCPSENSIEYPTGSGTFHDYGYNSYGVGSETNSFGLSGEISKEQLAAVREAQIQSPAEMISLGDGFWGGGGAVGDGAARLQRLAGAVPGSVSEKRSEKRHAGRAVVGFVDGHAEALSLSSLFEDDSDSALSRWNRDHKPHRGSLR